MNECELNFSEICRGCKRVEVGMTSIFDEPTNPPINEMLYAIASLSVQRNDGLPSLMCKTCCDALQNAYDFRQQLIQTESELWKILAQQKATDETNEVNTSEDIGIFLRSLLLKSNEAEDLIDTPISSSGLHFGDNVEENVVEVAPELVTLSEVDPLPENFSSNDVNCSVNVKQEEGNMIHQKKVYVCTICEIKFSRLYHIKRHLHTHRINSPFSCKRCNRTYSRKDKMQEHYRSCDGKIKPACDVCNKGFKCAETLAIHKETRHSNSTRQIKTLTEDDLKDINLKKYYNCVIEYVENSSLSSDDDEGNNEVDNDNDDTEMDVDPSLDSTEAHIKEGDKDVKPKKCKLFACALSPCDFTCRRLSHMKRHLVSHSRNKPFECSKCNRMFGRKDKLTRHFKLCDGIIKMACEVCNIGFRSEEKLAEHRKIHESSKTIQTQLISMDLKDLEDPNKLSKYYMEIYDYVESKAAASDDDDDNDDDAKEMNNMEDDSGKLDASDGDYVPSARRKHVKKKKKNIVSGKIARRPGRPSKIKKTEPKPQFVCPVCDESFERITLLEAHGSEYHADQQVLKCAYCDALFSRVYAMNRHMQLHKAKRNAAKLKAQAERMKEKQYECDKCLVRFSTDQARIYHMRKHTGNESFVCRRCSKPFMSKSNLIEHLKFHDKTRKFLCSECGQSFVRSDYLTIHMRRHRGEKPFKCKFCGKGFPRVTDLKVHERYHTGEKTHLCVVCGRGFSRAYNLTVHMRTHTGEKPYKCTYCESAFAQCNDLKSHIRRHTGERFQCDLCPQNFIMGYELIQHKRKEHGLNVVSNTRRLYNITECINPDDPMPETITLPKPVIPCTSLVKAPANLCEKAQLVTMEKEEAEIVYS